MVEVFARAIAKVADFGLAKIVSSMTMLKTMCGTPSYLAPEVVKGDAEGYSVQVDSWSVGVIVFSAYVPPLDSLSVVFA